MNTKPTLVILAAGMASRYGSMKQTQSFGPAGETIMEYSIYDAIKAGFGKVVFIIRKEFEDSFKNAFEPKLTGKIKTEYVFQELTSFTNNFPILATRVKPWGTGHALLCTNEIVKEPFVVINADDFYGTDAFITAANYFKTSNNENDGALVAFQLGNTLSDNGSVSRGVCEVYDNHTLKSVTERIKIYRDGSHIIYEEGDKKIPLRETQPVSMNFWCFTPSVYKVAYHLFQQFLHNKGNEEKSEFLLTNVVDEMIAQGISEYHVLTCTAKWFGVTYKEDAPVVEASIHYLVKEGKYPNNLWA
jgi:UTP-glucose-1-phosphate uridylyltransferase